jgi:hypothetical protein
VLHQLCELRAVLNQQNRERISIRRSLFVPAVRLLFWRPVLFLAVRYLSGSSFPAAGWFLASLFIASGSLLAHRRFLPAPGPATFASSAGAAGV